MGLVKNCVVECNPYGPDRPVGIEVARALYATQVDETFSNASLVTTSHWQDDVERFAMSKWDSHAKDFNGLIDCRCPTCLKKKANQWHSTGIKIGTTSGARARKRGLVSKRRDLPRRRPTNDACHAVAEYTGESPWRVDRSECQLLAHEA